MSNDGDTKVSKFAELNEGFHDNNDPKEFSKGKYKTLQHLVGEIDILNGYISGLLKYSKGTDLMTDSSSVSHAKDQGKAIEDYAKRIIKFASQMQNL